MQLKTYLDNLEIKQQTDIDTNSDLDQPQQPPFYNRYLLNIEYEYCISRKSKNDHLKMIKICTIERITI